MDQSANKPAECSVRIELYGMPRRWADRDELNVSAATLGEALRELEQAAPNLCPVCIADGRLQAGFAANINGQRFTREPSTVLAPGDCVLIVSTDAGG